MAKMRLTKNRKELLAFLWENGETNQREMCDRLGWSTQKMLQTLDGMCGWRSDATLMLCGRSFYKGREWPVWGLGVGAFRMMGDDV